VSRKKYYMVIDTETCGDYVFDIGYRVIDRKGRVYANGSYVVREYIENPSVLGMFDDRFSKDKIGKYYFDLWANNGGFKVASFAAIRDEINTMLNAYNATVCAYNLSFDLKHLRKTANYFGYECFFTAKYNHLDIWHMAMSTLATRKYIMFCLENNLFTKTGNIPTGAEVMYRYIINDVNFIEAHTAHEDCIIECEIMRKCFSRKTKFQTAIVGMPLHNKEWQRIQTTREEM